LPPLYLIHFYYGLSKGTHSGNGCPEAEQCDPSLSVGAKLYLALITASGMLLLTFAGLYWHSDDRARFVGYLVVAILASACKIRLPGMTGTMSISFVVLLAAIVQLTIPETVIIAAVEAVVQCLWRPKRRPQSMQVFFNVAALGLSSALACFGCRLLQSTVFADSLAVNLLVATAVCYLANTIAVSTALCLVERKPVSAIFAPCYFWSFPYYLVGASAAGLMVATSRAASWQPSLLALPLMALVFISYRLHVTRAVAPR